MPAEKEQEKKKTQEVEANNIADSEVKDEKKVEKEVVTQVSDDKLPADETQADDKQAGEEGDLPKKKKRKVRRQIQRGKAYIRSTYNNTVITLTDLHGNGLAWSSAGLLGFKGAKKATTYAANQVVLDVTEKVQKYGLSDLEVYVKGVGSGREAAIRALAQKGFNLSLIKDTTPIPHNGCRPRKPRRV